MIDIKTISIYFLLIFTHFSAINAQSLTYDSGFGTNGKKNLTWSINDYARCMTQQPDGKIIVVGNAYVNDVLTLVVARLLSNGTLDNTFGTNGTQSYSSINFTKANKVIVTSDNKILIAGTFSSNTMGLVRLNTDGSLDLTFNIVGWASFLRPTIYQSFGYSVTIQSDGKIILAGSEKDGGPYFSSRAMLVRVLSNGQLDATFGTNGFSVIDDFNRDEARSVKVLANGKILISGNGGRAFIARFNSNGSLDSGFGVSGTAEFNSTNLGYGSSDIEILSTGKILYIGNVNTGGSSNAQDIILLRFNAIGTLDLTFNGGYKIIDRPNSSEKFAGYIMQKNNQLVVLSQYQESTSTNYAMIMRINIDGNTSFDNSFYNNTYFYVLPYSDSESSNQACIMKQSDGKILTFSLDKTAGVSVVRFNDNSNIIPVELTDFTAQYRKEENSVVLNWQTASELNSHSFDIERAIDGKQFVKIGEVKAFGTTNQVQNYTYLDETLSPQYSQFYYRLRQVDKDNKVDYSLIRSIDIDKKNKSSVKIYPNPNNGQFIANVSASGTEADMTIQNSQGKVIWKGIIDSAKQNQNIQLAEVANGLYFVSCKNSEGAITTVKFVIDR